MILKKIYLILFIVIPIHASGQLKVAIIQYSIRQPDSVGIDAARFTGFVREAAANGAKLIVGPETSFYRYDPWLQNGTTILDMAGEYADLVKQLSVLCKELNIFLVVGLREPSGDPAKPVYNTGLFFGENGEIMGEHRKLNPSNSEKAFTKAGSPEDGDTSPFITPLGRVGMLICKDMDNSLSCRDCPDWDVQLADKGLDLVIGLNGDPSRGWVKVVRACQTAKCYGIGANLAQNSWDSITGGNSGFVDPGGKVISEAGTGERIIYHDLPLNKK